MTTSAAIFGCSGPALSEEEIAFFRDVQPWGFILFARNIEAPEQVRRLTDSLRAIVGRDDAPILIDQEGGRIARLVPPHWRLYPPGRAYGELPQGQRREITWLGGRLIAHDLASVGVNVDCVPVLDVPDPDGHEIIGDRAYGDTPEQVAELGRAASEGLMAGGVLPIVKHIPGHGRAKADSHFELPVVDTPFAELDARDFAPFRALNDMPMAMTAHVIYSDVDADQSATTSRACFDRVIRGAIGFEGLVMCDDLSMKALSGGLDERARASLAAGCDVVLHCNGDMAEMRQVMAGAGALEGRAAERAAAALAPLRRPMTPFDGVEARARFDAAFGGRYA